MPKYGIDYNVEVVREYIDKIEFGKDAINTLGKYPELSQDLSNIISAQIRTLSHLMCQYEDTIRGLDVNARNDKFKLDARTLGLRLQNVYKNLSKAEGFDKAMIIVTKNETIFEKDPQFLNNAIGEAFGSVVKFYIEDLKKITCSMDDLKLELSATLMNKIPDIQKDYYLEYKLNQAEEQKMQDEEEKNKLTFVKYIKILKNVVTILDSNVEYSGKEDDRKKVSIDLQKFLSESMYVYSNYSTSFSSFEIKAKEEELANMLHEAGAKLPSAKKRAHNMLNDPYVDADDIEYVKTNMGYEYIAVVEFFGKTLDSLQMEKILKKLDLDFSEFINNANKN